MYLSDHQNSAIEIVADTGSPVFKLYGCWRPQQAFLGTSF